jgi:hypothetical protein
MRVLSGDLSSIVLFVLAVTTSFTVVAKLLPQEKRDLRPRLETSPPAFAHGPGAESTLPRTDVDGLPRLGDPTGVQRRGAPNLREPAMDASVGPPARILVTFACDDCHELDRPGAKQGPSLVDVGERSERAEIHRSILDPDAEVARPFPRRIMAGQLERNGFYERMTPSDYTGLVDWLADNRSR